MPDVSVILPTCDRPELLPRALGSVLAQTGVDFEVVLVDSNHRTGRVADNPAVRAMLRDPRVVLVDPTERPYSAPTARNIGLSRARGAWISYLDDDDKYLAGRLEAPLELARATGAPLVLCGYYFAWPRRRRKRQVAQTEFRGDEMLTDARFITSMMFHRNDPVFRFDARVYTGDDRLLAFEMILRLQLKRVPNVARPLVVMYPQEVSVHENKEAAWAAYRSALRLARRIGFSAVARRQMLVTGAIDRALGGFGSWGHLLGLLAELLRTQGPAQWRFAAYALLTRAKSSSAGDTRYGSDREAAQT